MCIEITVKENIQENIFSCYFCTESFVQGMQFLDQNSLSCSLFAEPLEVDDWGDNDDGDEDVAEGDDNDDGDEGNDPLHVDDDSTDMPRETSNYSQVCNDDFFLLFVCLF